MTAPAKATLKCVGEGCTNTKAWAFRDVGFWHGKPGQNLCDECYGHRFGDFTCYKCEKNCFEEDAYKDQYQCGRCTREEIEREIDKNTDRDIAFQKHGL